MRSESESALFTFDAYVLYSRALDHVFDLGPISVYELVWNGQCLNDLREVQMYDLGTLTP